MLFKDTLPVLSLCPTKEIEDCWVVLIQDKQRAGSRKAMTPEKVQNVSLQLRSLLLHQVFAIPAS